MALVIGLGFWQLGQGAYIPAKAWFAQELMQRAWGRTTDGTVRARPWPWADTWPVARLKAPHRNVDLIVLAGGTGRTLAFGPGHMSASALPGERGNVVIAGHRDTHFRFLKDIEPGELLTVESHDGPSYTYEVVDIDIVDSRRGGLLLDADTSMLSLVTCYPFDTHDSGGPLRYVVTARIRG
ncbi:MAG: class GN sortase [Pseudomonadota bacterium]